MSTITVTNIKATGETASRAVSGVAAAWVNFNGQGTVAIRDSNNVSSLTDSGVGIYQPNFLNDMANANYASPTGSSGFNAASVNYALGVESTNSAFVRLRHQNGNGGEEDLAQNHCCVLGDLA